MLLEPLRTVLVRQVLGAKGVGDSSLKTGGDMSAKGLAHGGSGLEQRER